MMKLFLILIKIINIFYHFKMFRCINYSTQNEHYVDAVMTTAVRNMVF